MNIFSRITNWLGGNANTQREGSQQTVPSISAHEDAPVIGVDSALQVSTAWACVTLWVDIISSLPLKVYSSDANGNKTEERNTRLYQILHDRPNRRQVAMQFWAQMILNYILRGNAYARVIRDGHGEVVSLWPLSADQVEVIAADDGGLLYVYTFNSQQYIYHENDILHIYGMGNGTVGLSPLDYMRSSVNLAISAQNHTSKTFRKNARRPGVLMSDTVLTDDQRKAVKTNFGDIVTGTEKELYVLEAQFKFDPLGMSPADIQLLETRQHSVEDLARWFGVPSSLINNSLGDTSLGSSTREIIEAFYKTRLRPKLELFEQCIHEFVLTPKQRAQGISVEFTVDAFLRMNALDRAEVDAKEVQNGLATRNEKRAKSNREPKPGGDMLTAQSNLMPLEMLGQQTNQGGSVPPETVEQ